MDTETKEEINKFIKESCEKLKVSNFVSATAKTIFYKAKTTISDAEWETLAATCIYLSCKISELYIPPEKFKSIVSCDLSIELETRIMKIIDFNFNFFDIYQFVISVCKTLNFNAEEKVERLDKIFSDTRVNSVGFLGHAYEVKHVCLAVFEKNEVELFERVYCVEVDNVKIEEARRSLLLLDS